MRSQRRRRTPSKRPNRPSKRRATNKHGSKRRRRIRNQTKKMRGGQGPSRSRSATPGGKRAMGQKRDAERRMAREGGQQEIRKQVDACHKSPCSPEEIKRVNNEVDQARKRLKDSTIPKVCTELAGKRLIHDKHIVPAGTLLPTSYEKALPPPAQPAQPAQQSLLPQELSKGDFPESHAATTGSTGSTGSTELNLSPASSPASSPRDDNPDDNPFTSPSPPFTGAGAGASTVKGPSPT